MIKGKKILALITARGGSKGIPGKNTRLLGGKPLVVWTIEAALDSRYVDRTVLSSDDEKIISVAEKAGAEVPFRRPANLATDEATSVDVVAHALAQITGFDYLLLLQPTSPFRTAADIDVFLEFAMEHKSTTCVSVTPSPAHPFQIFSLSADRLTAFVPAPPQRRQDLPPAYVLNGALYLVETNWFLKNRMFLSPETVGFVMPTERSLDIDTPADWEEAERLVQKKLH